MKVDCLDFHEFDVGCEENVKSYFENLLPTGKKSILLAVGEGTVVSLLNLLPLANVTTIHSCHMVTTAHDQLVGKIDFLALPVHAVGEFEKKIQNTQTKLIQTIGVSHNRQISAIEDAYINNKFKISQNKLYLGLVLGGDASKSNHEVLLFTESNARELAQSVAPVLGTRYLLITNGSRTGKHRFSSCSNNFYEEIKSSHRDGKIDFITLAFIEELQKCGLSQDKFILFDFQFNSASDQDMNLFLGALRATNSSILIPGESTSMISECIDVLMPQSIIVYQTTSMSKTHDNHVENELKAKRIKWLERGYKNLNLLLNQQDDIEKFKKQKNEASSISAAETIANELIKIN